MKILILLTSMCFLQGCVTRYKVKTLEENPRWDKGLAYSEAENKSLNISAAIEKQNNSIIRFIVRVSNNSKKAILIDPNDFILKGLALKEKEQKAIDPEKKLEIVNDLIELNQTELNFLNMEMMNPSLINWNRNRIRQSVTERTYQLQRESALRTRSRSYHNNRMSLSQIKRDLEENFLRKTHLAPDENMQGSVEFDVTFNKGDLKLIYKGFQPEIYLDYKSFEKE